MNIQWDAEKYTSNFSFVHKYGNSVTELIEAPEGSRVLDLGCGNGALAKAFAEQGYSYQVPFYFPSIGEYASLLEQAGFEVRYAVLFDRMTELMGEDGMKDWIRMFISTPFYAVSKEAQREAIRNRAVELLKKDLYRDGKWYADYVRLRMRAIKGGRK